MATLTIRNLDEGTKAQQRIQAARHGRSSAPPSRPGSPLLVARAWEVASMSTSPSSAA